MVRPFLFAFVCSVILGSGALFFFHLNPQNPQEPLAPQVTLSPATLPAAAAIAGTALLPEAADTPTTTPVSPPVNHEKPSNTAVIQAASTSANEVARIQNPYDDPPESFTQVNVDARAALVNILCEPRGSSSLNPISGSGVVIDPRGVILTNAHVAQYVLLSESPSVDLDCTVRTGSPAQAHWKVSVLYIPPVWVEQHASEILDQHPTGTGEHDYALLLITGSTDGTPVPAQFPYLPFDTRSAIGFPGDQVLVASYPAEFIGGIAAQYDLYADSSVTTIKQLLTFGAGTPDLLSLGGVIEAQSGSSGGAVVNAWGRLVGLIATTSDAPTTADRDLRAVALSYIDTDITAQSGTNLTTILEGDLQKEEENFRTTVAPALVGLYIDHLAPSQAN